MNRMTILLLLVCVSFFLFPALWACTGDSDEDDETFDNDSGDDDEPTCDDLADLIVDAFTFLSESDETGTAFTFNQIVVCNVGGITAEAGHQYGFWLSENDDFSGNTYLAYESEPLDALEPAQCQTFTLEHLVSDVPQGIYYVFMIADTNEVIDECSEWNNKGRSAGTVVVAPKVEDEA